MKKLRTGCLAAAALLVAGSASSETLQQAVRTALTSNPEIRATTAEARASAYDLLKLQSEYQPIVTLYGKAQTQRVYDPGSQVSTDLGDTKFARQLGIEAELVLLDGNRRANLVYSNAARVDGNIFRLLDASETMALNVVEVYIDLYRHLRLQEAAARNLRRHREIGQKVNELVDGGRLPLSDRLQVDDRIRAAQIALIDIRRQGRDAEARYERIVGKKRSGPVSLPGVKAPANSQEALARSAVDASYRVRIAAIEVERAKYEGAVVEADRMPRLSLNAGAKAGRDIDGSAGPQTDTYVGLRLNWILHKGGRDAERNAWVERKSKALAEQHVAVGEVRELAQRTWNSYIANGDRVHLLSAQLNVNRDLVGQYQSEFEAGTRSLLEVLDAEQSAFNVEFEGISAQAAYTFSIYRMLAAQSRLAKHFGVKPSNTALIPDFRERALANPTSVFKTEIPPME